MIVDAAGRGADLTRQLLTFSRLHTFSPQEIDTPELLDRTEQLLRRVIGSLVTLETRIDPAAPPIFADPSQMDQVLLNLALNARDAMPDGGTLTLTLGSWTHAESDSPRYAAIAPGEYCRITVADTGVGMDTETLERIFEPFFTTKDVGKGTGLGLATSYGIVTSMDGHLLVCSAPGEGTEFEVIIPASFVGTTERPSSRSRLAWPRRSPKLAARAWNRPASTSRSTAGLGSARRRTTEHASATGPPGTSRLVRTAPSPARK